MIRSPLLAAVQGIGHAHSERCDGAAGPRGAPGVAQVRTRLAAEAGAQALVVPEQVHGGAVAIVSARDGEASIPRTDGLVTATAGIALLVQGADCPLAAFADGRARVAGVFHSGWRGTAARIAARAVDAARDPGADPGRVVAAVFPGIGPCCFEVGPEVRETFGAAFGARADTWFRPRAGDRMDMDLRAAIVETLVESGVGRERVEIVRGCTACGGNLWSHRASRGGPERHGLVVAVR